MGFSGVLSTSLQATSRPPGYESESSLCREDMFRMNREKERDVHTSVRKGRMSESLVEDNSVLGH